MGWFSRSKKPKVDAGEQCAKCRNVAGDKFHQDLMLRQYGHNPKELLLIATGMISQNDPHGFSTATAIMAGGLLCSKCHKKYCHCSAPNE